MYLNKRDKDYVKQLVFRDYCLTCNTREKVRDDCTYTAKDENDLISKEMYVHKLLIEKFDMTEEELSKKRKIYYISETY